MKLFLYIYVLTVLSLTSSVCADSYAADTNIYELTPANFDKVVYKSNYTTVVKFYAPWCGYCKQLQPIFQRLGRFLHLDGKYAVNVASVNCDKEYNKPLCLKHRIKGFPTIMVFRPPKFQRGQVSTSRHVPEVYNGERTLKPMVNYITSRIKNYVKKIHNVNSKSFPEWLSSDEGLHKVLLLTSANDITPLYKTMAIDFLETLSFGTISLKKIEKEITVELDGESIELPVKAGESLPILLVYKPETKSFARYTDGKLTRKDKLEKWLIAETGAMPGEGSLSKKEKKYNAKYRGKKKASGRARDEL